MRRRRLRFACGYCDGCAGRLGWCEWVIRLALRGRALVDRVEDDGFVTVYPKV